MFKAFPAIMGILNVTPDSMYDGGRYTTGEAALKQVEKMIEEGVHIVDIGGESTRPQAQPISVEEELSRVLPMVKLIRKYFTIPLSIDTSQPLVMEACVGEGVNFINDVRALNLPGALQMAARLKTPICLMHSDPSFQSESKNPILKLKDFFSKRIQSCEEAGILRENLWLDPGLGAGFFGKTPEQILWILKNLSQLKIFELPLFIGVSYKSFISEILNVSLSERLPGALAATVIAILGGARMVRTHDVKITREVVEMTCAIDGAVCQS